MNYKISGSPVTKEKWAETLLEHPPGEGSILGDRCPVAFMSPPGHGVVLIWDESEEPRKVAAAFVDAILGQPGPYQQEINRSERKMGPYETALWKIELELGGELTRVLEPIIDAKPGEVRRVLREAFPQEEN